MRAIIAILALILMSSTAFAATESFLGSATDGQRVTLNSGWVARVDFDLLAAGNQLTLRNIERSEVARITPSLDRSRIPEGVITSAVLTVVLSSADEEWEHVTISTGEDDGGRLLFDRQLRIGADHVRGLRTVTVDLIDAGLFDEVQDGRFVIRIGSPRVKIGNDFSVEKVELSIGVSE